MKKQVLYFSLALLVAAFPFGDMFFRVFRGISVSFFHTFQRLAPFSVSLPDLFHKYIHFYLYDFFIVSLLIATLSLKEASWKDLFWNRHSRFLTLYGTVALASIAFSLFFTYFFQYVTVINLFLSFTAFGLIYHLLKKERGWIPRIFWMILIVATTECFIGTGQFLMQKSLGLSFLSEPQIHPGMHNIAVYPMTSPLPWIQAEHSCVLRAYGTFDHPTTFGCYLVLALFVSYYLFLKTEKWGARLFLYCFIPLCILTLTLTFARGPFFAWVVATLIFFGTLLFRPDAFSQPERKRSLILGSFLGAGFLIVITLLFNQLMARGGFVNYNALSEISDSGRLLFYKIAIALFYHHPLLGIGHNGFALFPYEILSPFFAGANPTGQLAHNVYLQIASETGLAGLACAFLFLLSLVRALFKTPLSSLTLTVGTMLLSLLLIGMVDHFLWAYASGRMMLFTTLAFLAVTETVRGCESAQKCPT
jgi:O-antigen ligase